MDKQMDSGCIVFLKVLIHLQTLNHSTGEHAVGLPAFVVLKRNTHVSKTHVLRSIRCRWVRMCIGTSLICRLCAEMRFWVCFCRICSFFFIYSSELDVKGLWNSS